MGSGLYRRSWTSLPTLFISAQRLFELPLPCVTVCHHISTGLYRSLSAQRPFELPLSCVTVCHHISTGLYRSLSAQRLFELPLSCVTVCHHISTGLYRSLSPQRHSERTVYIYKFSRITLPTLFCEGGRRSTDSSLLFTNVNCCCLLFIPVTTVPVYDLNLSNYGMASDIDF